MMPILLQLPCLWVFSIAGQLCHVLPTSRHSLIAFHPVDIQRHISIVFGGYDAWWYCLWMGV